MFGPQHGKLKCDSCGASAPDVVGPILIGINNWTEVEIDGELEGRKFKAEVLLCGHPTNRQLGCAPKMRAFVDSGGVAGEGPKSPDIRTFRGGQDQEPKFLDAEPAKV